MSVKKAIIAIVIGGFIMGTALHVYRIFNIPVDKESTKRETFTIAWQENPKEITMRLKEKKLIRSSLAFYWHLKKNNLAQKIKAGTFMLSPKYSMTDIAKILTSSSQAEIVLTIPEGMNIQQIDQRLVDLNLITAGEFESCAKLCRFDKQKSLFAEETNLEGYFFPDTYFIDPDTFSPQNLIERMLDNFHGHLDQKLLGQIEKNGRNLKEIITIASLLEKEIKTENDLPIVAGILWKRLDNNWPLGVDATLLYIPGVTRLDGETLMIDSPYNTRKYKGLPPTPIGNPGMKTIKATVFPEKSPYWFYLTTPDGKVIYAQTNEEHGANKQRYLKPPQSGF